MNDMPELDIRQITISKNLTSEFSDAQLLSLGMECHEAYSRDLASRGDWEERMADAVKLAMQVTETKSYPWQDAANIKFPLLAIASLQFASRAYPALIDGTDLVHCKVWANDPADAWHQRANRISKHMSWQITEQDYDWEDEMDRLLIVLPIMGCAFKKVYYRSDEHRNEAELVMPEDLVVDYYTKVLTSETRVTHIQYMSSNEVVSRMRQGLYREVDLAPPSTDRESAIEAARNERQHTEKPTASRGMPRTILEQHTMLDLDGDGFEEPYIVTIDRDSKQILRIVARFTPDDVTYRDGQVIGIKARGYFVKYGFITSPDGGFYDVGFGALLGPINDTVNTAINQILDAGSLANGAGGFLGRGVRVLGGNHAFRPFEWKRIDSPGTDLRQNIFPLPVREPSRVLLEMLTVLINYAERLTGATDIMTGISPGQNTPAETTRGVMQEAMRVYSSIVKRIWRAMKIEIRMLFQLNQIYLEADSEKMRASGMIQPGDYAETRTTDIIPGADPNVISDQQKLSQSEMLLRLSETTPGFDREYVMHKVLRAMKVDDEVRVYPGIGKVPPLQNPKIEIEKIKQQGKQSAAQAQFHIQLAKMEQQERVLQSQIDKNEAQAALFLAQAGGEAQGKQIAEFDSMIAAQKEYHRSLVETIKLMKEAEDGRAPAGFGAGLPPMEKAPHYPNALGGVPGNPNGAGGEL